MTHSSLQPQLPSGGALVAASTHFSPSERQDADDAQAKLAAIIRSSSDAIVTKTLGGVITSWNAAAEQIFGYPADEAIGKFMLMLFPDDRLDEEADLLGRMARGESISHYETVRLRKDGQRIDVSVALSPVFDSGGRITGVAQIARDISARKRAELEALESELRFQTMANSMSQLAWIAGPDGQISWYNQRWYEYTGTTL